MALFDRAFADLSTLEFHEIVKLRVDVFVVEQACAYSELDGRDVERTTRHMWIADSGRISAYLRVLDDGDERRIGRVATAAAARNQGLAGQLVDHAVTATSGPWVLHAQAHLVSWYGARGFHATGPEFPEDGIPHVPMRRD